MFSRRPKIIVETERLCLRLPEMHDHKNWAAVRQESIDFLQPWEPLWSSGHFSRSAFSNRVHWARKSFDNDRGLPLFIFQRSNHALVGAITLDNIRRGFAQAGTLGYWIGQAYARQGFMSEAIAGVVHHGFTSLDLSRIEAATLPENKASRGVLERCGFKYEGVAQAYLQIQGRWRTHVLYASLRHDRRGRTDVG